MKRTQRLGIHVALLVILIIALVITSARSGADSGTCGGGSVSLPFTDIAGNTFFCEIAEAYFSGLTFGTTATTYSPGLNVPREQIAAFTTRTMDQSLRRGSSRAALNQWWTSTPHYVNNFGTTTVGGAPFMVQSDGSDLWVAGAAPGGTGVARVRASDGKLLETWSGAVSSFGVLVAMGRIFVAGSTSPGNLYMINPNLVAGSVNTIVSNLGDVPYTIAFDGNRIWTANFGQGANPGSISIITPGATWTVQTITEGFGKPTGITFDGLNIWVTDRNFPHKLHKLDSNGAILQSVPMPDNPGNPTFDGTNIWVPNYNDTVVVVRASTGDILATLTGNGLHNPATAAFDGERILVTNQGDNVSLWKAADLTPIGFLPTGLGQTYGVCSDGINFWITYPGGKLLRF